MTPRSRDAAREAVRFLTSLAQALSTMALYANGHPARERAVDLSYGQLRELRRELPRAQFSFLGGEVVFGQQTLRELKEWDWGVRLANAGIQRLELSGEVEREDYETFLEEVLSRLSGVAASDTAAARPGAGGGTSGIRFGAVGGRGTGGEQLGAEQHALPAAPVA